MALTNAQKQQARVERMTGLGFKMVRNLWAYPEDEAAIRKYAKNKTRQRQKINQPHK